MIPRCPGIALWPREWCASMSRRHRLPALVLLTSLLVAAGCGRESGPYDEEANPKEEIQAALAAARGDGKRVLLDFGANWCPDCWALERIFAEEPVRAVLESGYHVVRIDIGRRDRNLEIVSQYGDPIRGGIPAVVILDSAGGVLATTAEGELANARSMASTEVLALLKRWAPQRPGSP